MLDPKLANEIEIVHLIYTKYRAQQRTQRWWKYFSILHRRLLRFVQNNKVDERSATFIVRKLAPSAARAFHSILAQGAFITLGFALLAALGSVCTLLQPHTRQVIRSASKAAHRHEILGEDEDVGEEMIDDSKESSQLVKPRKAIKSRTVKTKSTFSDEDRDLPPPPPKKEKSKSKKKSKKSKHSAIDDIFNF